MRVAILDDYQNAALKAADWKSLTDTEISVFTEYIEGEDALAKILAPFDVIVAMRERTRFPKSLLQRLDNLKLLVTTGMRNLAIDMDSAKARSIIVSGTKMMAHATYEHTWALIMALTKQIPREDRVMHAGGWQEGIGVGLKGKTLGILGLGTRGSEIARVGQVFGMQTIAWSQNLTAEKADENKVRLVKKEELFAESDVLTIHLVLSERTRGIVGSQELALMKPGSFLINTSRGPIVDENALIETLKNKQIAGAAIDVFDIEPLPADHPIRSLDNVVLTGHTGYLVQELYELVYGQALENIKQWRGGAPIRILNG
ncbi:MAG: D-2-hydroxyacid dehydrogenase family protein [SAR324 cluster bacterium]|nr:D-2-hydroxyacid dehydrogenase family protein [SAR324 cluster bacterium]